MGAQTCAHKLYTKYGWPNLEVKAFHLIRWLQIYLYVFIKFWHCCFFWFRGLMDPHCRALWKEGNKIRKTDSVIQGRQGLRKGCSRGGPQERKAFRGLEDLIVGREGEVECSVRFRAEGLGNIAGSACREKSLWWTVWVQRQHHTWQEDAQQPSACRATGAVTCKQGIRGTWREGYHVPSNATIFRAWA